MFVVLADIEMSVSGGSDDSPASDHCSHSNPGSHNDTSSLSMHSTQPLLEHVTSSSNGGVGRAGGESGAPKSYGYYANKNNSNPRHVRFSGSERIVYDDYDRNGTMLIRNPNVLMDGTDGTFV